MPYNSATNHEHTMAKASTVLLELLGNIALNFAIPWIQIFTPELFVSIWGGEVASIWMYKSQLGHAEWTY